MIIDFSLSPVWKAIGEISGGTISLDGYWTSAETKDYVDTAVSGIDLSNYYTKSETDSAITAVEDHLFDVEEVTASALTELHNAILELSGSSVDLSGYYTSGETDAAISAATAGKADAASVTANTNNLKFPYWNEQGIITGSYYRAATTQLFGVNGRRIDFFVGAGSDNLPDFYAPLSAGTAGEVLVSTGNGAPVWSAFTGGDTQELQDQIDTLDEVVSAALVDLNDRKVESAYVSTIWKGTQAEYDAIVTKDAATLYIIVNNS